MPVEFKNGYPVIYLKHIYTYLDKYACDWTNICKDYDCKFYLMATDGDRKTLKKLTSEHGEQFKIFLKTRIAYVKFTEDPWCPYLYNHSLYSPDCKLKWYNAIHKKCCINVPCKYCDIAKLRNIHNIEIKLNYDELWLKNCSNITISGQISECHMEKCDNITINSKIGYFVCEMTNVKSNNHIERLNLYKNEDKYVYGYFNTVHKVEFSYGIYDDLKINDLYKIEIDRTWLSDISHFNYLNAKEIDFYYFHPMHLIGKLHGFKHVEKVSIIRGCFYNAYYRNSDILHLKDFPNLKHIECIKKINPKYMNALNINLTNCATPEITGNCFAVNTISYNGNIAVVDIDTPYIVIPDNTPLIINYKKSIHHELSVNSRFNQPIMIMDKCPMNLIRDRHYFNQPMVFCNTVPHVFENCHSLKI